MTLYTGTVLSVNLPLISLFKSDQGLKLAIIMVTDNSVVREAVYRASEAGVRVVAHSIRWSEDGAAVWGDSLPINLRDEADKF